MIDDLRKDFCLSLGSIGTKEASSFSILMSIQLFVDDVSR